jgi:hypothetical protein
MVLASSTKLEQEMTKKHKESGTQKTQKKNQTRKEKERQKQPGEL